MTRSKLIWCTMILAVGTTGAAWAQPPRDGQRDARNHTVYSGANHARGDQDRARRGDRDDHVRRNGDRNDVYRGGRWSIFGNDHDRDDVYRNRAWGIFDRHHPDRDHDGDRH